MKYLLFASLCSLPLFACTSDAELVANLRTDLAPGYEFDSIRVELAGPASAGGRVEIRSVTPSDDFIEGVSIGSFGGLENGSLTLITTLRDADGRTVIERVTRVQVEGSTGITVLMTRDCRDVACPGPAGGALTACFAEMCVDEGCSAESSELCGEPECSADADCPAASACALPRCLDGGCFYQRRDDECASNEWCNVDEGCQPIEETDGGVPDGGTDAGMDGGCAADTADCDMDETNGCEIDLQNDERHCGACGNACAGTQICEAGRCSDGPVVALSAGYAHACALHQSGAIYCWGEGRQGQLGDGMGRISDLPVRVTGVEDAVEISAGRGHTCAVTGTGSLYCWGDNTYGQLADGTMTPSPTPVEAATDVAPFIAVGAGLNHTCGIKAADGTAWCYGDNSDNQLGYGGPGQRSEPPASDFDISPAPQGNFMTITLGARASCGLRGADELHCFGSCACAGRYGSVGRTLTSVRLAEFGDSHICAIRLDGTVQCLGRGTSGELGRGDMVDSGSWGTVMLDDGSELLMGADVSGGVRHSCAVTNAGDAYCWGLGTYGALGTGTEENALTGVPVSGLSGVEKIAAGDGFTCALTDAAQVHCWGRNNVGQLGDGTRTDRLTPVMVYE